MKTQQMPEVELLNNADRGEEIGAVTRCVDLEEMKTRRRPMPRAMGKLAVSVLVTVLLLVGQPRAANAAEGAGSHYLPGTAGDVLIAQPPKPGWLTGGMLWYEVGNVNRAVLQGRVDLSLDLDLFLAIPTATYTFEKKVLGGTYTVAIAVPFGYGNLDATLVFPVLGPVGTSDDSFALSDLFVTPLQLNWAAGSFSFKLAESIIAPTGKYDTGDLVNLGRNYWSFDTVGAVSWFNSKTGTGVDIVPGIMFNTENNDTNYKTGTEFHLDFTANQFLSEGFAFGIRGYYYKQLTGDSGSGALLGGFKSDAFGLGPGFVWIPKSSGGKLSVVGKWIHDFETENRFDSDYYILAAYWKF
jgi:hypothetical protein